ncbi:sel1 repeat family protein [Helicobacter muridarum]|nr:tetratricopeptide repeat protein [Helicobacter muridarum]TLE00017.1 sel1 repeat family protein [Helicobacter muridarum]
MRLIYSTIFIRLLVIMLPCIVLFLIACANKQTNATKAFKNSNLVSNSNNKSLKTSTIDNEKEYKELHLIQEQFSRQLLLKQNEYTKLCDRNEADSCVKLALSHQLNYSATQYEIYNIYNKANKIYDEECRNGNMSACSGLGALYESGDGVEQDIYKSKALYKKACDGKDARGCLNIGLEIRGCISCESNMENIKRALPYFEKACKYGSNSACHMKTQSQRDLENLINSNL